MSTQDAAGNHGGDGGQQYRFKKDNPLYETNRKRARRGQPPVILPVSQGTMTDQHPSDFLSSCGAIVTSIPLVGTVDLGTLKDCWSRLHAEHPFREHGLHIIDELMLRPESQCDLKSIRLAREMGEGDVFYDVSVYQGCFTDTVNGETSDEASFMDFVTGWSEIGSGKGVAVNGSYVRSLFALEVPSTNRHRGFGSCLGRDIPDTLQDPHVYVEGKPSASNPGAHFKTAITPAGQLTGPHHDGAGYGQLLLTTMGYKVLIWFNDSVQLFQAFEPFHGRRNGDAGAILLSAVRCWPGLRWAVCKPGDYFEMPPATVHAVLSPTNSTLSGWVFLSRDWLRTGLLQTQIMQEMDIWEKRLNENCIADDWYGLWMDQVEREVHRLNQWSRGAATWDAQDREMLLDLIATINTRTTQLQDHPNFERLIGDTPADMSVRKEKKVSASTSYKGKRVRK